MVLLPWHCIFSNYGVSILKYGIQLCSQIGTHLKHSNSCRIKIQTFLIVERRFGNKILRRQLKVFLEENHSFLKSELELVFGCWPIIDLRMTGLFSANWLLLLQFQKTTNHVRFIKDVFFSFFPFFADHSLER